MLLTLDGINLILLLLLKPALVMGCLLYILRHSPHRSASASHWLMVLGICTPVLLLLARTFIPEWRLYLEYMPLAEIGFWRIDLADTEAASVRMLYLLVATYVLGAIWGISYLFFGLRDIYRLTQCANEVTDPAVLRAAERVSAAMGEPRPVSIRLVENNCSPVMWGWRRPVILLPEEAINWDEGRLMRVLAHEYAHIIRADWPLKIASQVICSLFWFLPPVWYAAERLNWYAELACDDRVVRAFECRAEYARDLLDVAPRQSGESIAALNYKRNSTVFDRIHAVLDGTRVRTTASAAGKYISLCLWSLVCIALATISVEFTTRENTGRVMDFYPLHFEAGTIRQNDLVSVERPLIVSLDDLKQWFRSSSQYYPAEEKLVVVGEPESTQQWQTEQPVNPIKHSPVSLEIPDIRVSGFLPVNIVTPAYPRHALRNNIEGRVVVEFDIDITGKVRNPHILSSDAAGEFDRAVLTAISASQFRPMTINGEPIITKNVTETFVFTIREY